MRRSKRVDGTRPATLLCSRRNLAPALSDFHRVRDDQEPINPGFEIRSAPFTPVAERHALVHLANGHEREGERLTREVAGIAGLESPALEQRRGIGIEDDHGQLESGDVGVAAGADVGQECVKVLVRVPHVEREALEVLEGLDRLQALRSGELVKVARVMDRLVRTFDVLLGHVTSSIVAPNSLPAGVQVDAEVQHFARFPEGTEQVCDVCGGRWSDRACRVPRGLVAVSRS